MRALWRLWGANVWLNCYVARWLWRTGDYPRRLRQVLGVRSQRSTVAYVEEAMTDALQKEAREAARSAQSFASVCVVSGSPRRADGKRSLVRIGYEQGYLAGLGARKKEIEELRAKMEAQPPSAKIERASRYEPCAECGFLLYRGKPAMHNCNKSLVIEAKDAEIASLRAKIEAVPVEEIRAVVDALTDRFEDSETSDCCDAIDRWLAGLGK